jgi:hypothetical protein
MEQVQRRVVYQLESLGDSSPHAELSLFPWGPLRPHQSLQLPIGPMMK